METIEEIVYQELKETKLIDDIKVNLIEKLQFLLICMRNFLWQFAFL